MWFIFSIAAAACFGIRGILYQWTSQRPINRNLLLLGVYFSGTVIALVSNIFAGQPWSTGVWVGVLMGAFSFIANAAMYRGYAVGKASIVALFTGLPPLVVVVVAYLLWQESLTTWQFISFFIVLIGLLLIKYSSDLKRGQWKGIHWGLLTMFFFGFTDVSSKQATLSGASTLPVLAVMFASGSILFGISWLLDYMKKKKSEQVPASSEEKNWTKKKTFGWGMIVGISNVAGMILLLTAFRGGITGIVSAINAMSVVLVIFYARFYLKEVMSRHEVIGLIVAIGGIVVLRVTS